MMRSKKTIVALLIFLVITMESIKKAETLSDCAKDCMPVCLKEKGATIDVCGPACETFCQQYNSKKTSKTGG